MACWIMKHEKLNVSTSCTNTSWHTCMPFIIHTICTPLTRPILPDAGAQFTLIFGDLWACSHTARVWVSSIVCLWILIYFCACIMYMNLWMDVYDMYVCLHSCIFIYLYACIYVCMYMYMYSNNTSTGVVQSCGRHGAMRTWLSCVGTHGKRRLYRIWYAMYVI